MKQSAELFRRFIKTRSFFSFIIILSRQLFIIFTFLICRFSTLPLYIVKNLFYTSFHRTDLKDFGGFSYFFCSLSCSFISHIFNLTSQLATRQPSPHVQSRRRPPQIPRPAGGTGVQAPYHGVKGAFIVRKGRKR